MITSLQQVVKAFVDMVERLFETDAIPRDLVEFVDAVLLEGYAVANWAVGGTGEADGGGDWPTICNTGVHAIEKALTSDISARPSDACAIGPACRILIAWARRCGQHARTMTPAERLRRILEGVVLEDPALEEPLVKATTYRGAHNGVDGCAYVAVQSMVRAITSAYEYRDTMTLDAVLDESATIIDPPLAMVGLAIRAMASGTDQQRMDVLDAYIDLWMT